MTSVCFSLPFHDSSFIVIISLQRAIKFFVRSSLAAMTFPPIFFLPGLLHIVLLACVRECVRLWPYFTPHDFIKTCLSPHEVRGGTTVAAAAAAAAATSALFSREKRDLRRPHRPSFSNFTRGRRKERRKIYGDALSSFASLSFGSVTLRVFFFLSLSSSRGTFLLSFPREILCCLKASFSHFQQRFFFFHLRMPSVPNLLGE